MRKKPYTARVRFIADKYGNEQLYDVLICDKNVFGKGFEKQELFLNSEKEKKKKDKKENENSVENVERATRRAKAKVRDLIVANSDLDYFITCTLNGNDFERDNEQMFGKKLDKWLNNMVTRKGLKYVLVSEWHKKSKGLHLHAVVNGSALELVDSGTVLRPVGGKPVKIATALRQGYNLADCRTVYNVKNWKYGFSTAIACNGNRGALSNYVSKYISKDFGCKIGGRYYRHGGDLKEPRNEYIDLACCEMQDFLDDFNVAPDNRKVYKFKVENFAHYIGWRNSQLTFSRL